MFQTFDASMVYPRHGGFEDFEFRLQRNNYYQFVIAVLLTLSTFVVPEVREFFKRDNNSNKLATLGDDVMIDYSTRKGKIQRTTVHSNFQSSHS